MQRIISAILAAGKIPYPGEGPLYHKRSIDISSIREYNVVIDELVAENDIAVTPPDFYSYFQKHPDEIPDGIHPNKIGYESMANLWFIALTQLKADAEKRVRSISDAGVEGKHVADIPK